MTDLASRIEAYSIASPRSALKEQQMIAVIKQNEAGEIVGWMMGADPDEIRRRADATLDHDLARLFYTMNPWPSSGKHVIAPGVTMLVQ